MTSTVKKIRRALLLWHRRIGAIIAVFLLLLSVTGILLNHTEGLRLSDRPIQSKWLLSRYGVELPEVVSFSVGDSWLSHMGGNYAYLNDQKIAFCEKPFYGAVKLTTMMVAVCRNSLLFLTPSGEIIERVDDLDRNVQAIAKNDDELLLMSDEKWFKIDTLSMEYIPLDILAEPIVAQTLPTKIEEQLIQAYRGEDIHWERIILDLHSGRLFGLSGVLLMDLVALALIWVAGSGVWVWLTRPKL